MEAFLTTIVVNGQVKRLIRHVKSGNWVSADATLTPNLREAVENETLSEALEFCRKRKLQGVEIVLRFGDPRYDSTIQLSDTVMIRRSEEDGPSPSQRGQG